MAAQVIISRGNGDTSGHTQGEEGSEWARDAAISGMDGRGAVLQAPGRREKYASVYSMTACIR